MKRTKLSLTQTSVNGQPYWLVTRPKPGGGRLKKHFKDYNEAEKFFQEADEQLLRHGTAAMAISERLRVEALEAERLLQPHNFSLLEAVNKFIANLETQKKSRPVEDAVEDYIDACKTNGHSHRYFLDLRSRLGRFSSAFQDKLLGEITTSDLDGWLRASGFKLGNRKSFKQRLKAFFNYGLSRNWCTSNPAKAIVIGRQRETPIGILSPDEFSRLLENASEPTLPYWLLGGFAGIRSAEIARLEWKDIHFDSNLIEVSVGKSKTASRRLVKMELALIAWLTPYRDHHGPICPVNLRKLLEADRQRAGITKWPNNALRHSFATYHLSHFQDAARLALELGHTNSSVIFRHYREMTKPVVAKKWWNVMPVGTANVLEIAASA